MKTKNIYLILISYLFFGFSSPSKYKLIIFSGSDWCSNCIRFEKNILSDPAFLKKAQEWNIEIEKIDFPQRKKLEKEVEQYNASVAEKYNFQGVFPTVIISNSETHSYREINYLSAKNTQDFIEILEPIISEKQL